MNPFDHVVLSVRFVLYTYTDPKRLNKQIQSTNCSFSSFCPQSEASSHAEIPIGLC
ncbi:Protein of unknown function [Pyronema omphalodes CBS 100304]|uniref:Uncharacterized protein n=1 Tax=Pyronema omphalodes (strain CBS 100304) TaxID=1076935 RepID=U4LVV1_PYROM|nr:Protein of unknown function [Pyronema omphalodes CBS 100304]